MISYKIELQNISTVYNINEFDKTFVLASYNSFLEIELNCDKENMIILNTCSFQKKMSNSIYVPTYSLKKCVLENDFKDSCVMKIL